MLRSLFRTSSRRESGQVLVLFAAGLIGFLAIVGMSIDVGRLVWARTQMQAAVDAAAIAAAQDMPSQSAAQATAQQYWLANSGFIQSNGYNINFSAPTFPTGNKAISIHADADISTWFLKLVGIDHWHVSADGDAASSVLDISLVMDISQSMCDDTYPRVDQRPNMSPGPSADIPHLDSTLSSTATTLSVSAADFNTFTGPISDYMTGVGYDQIPSWVDTSKLTSSQYTKSGSKYVTNANTPYWAAATNNNYQGKTFHLRSGLIMIGPPGNGEIMQITDVNSNPKTGTYTLTVTRGVNDKRGSQTDPTYIGVPSIKVSHAAGDQIWMDRNGNGCTGAAPNSGGPYEPYDTLVTDAKQFVGLFNPSYDEFGVTYFSSTATLKQSLTGNFSTVDSKIDSMGAPNGGTNTAHGLAVGRQVLDGSGKRANAARVIVLITDGRAKEYCGTTTAPGYSNGYDPTKYSSTSCPNAGGGVEGNPTANWAAQYEAIRATDPTNENITLFVIGLGAGVDKAWLEQLADGGVEGVGPCQNNQKGCRYYDAPTSAELQAAFTSVAAQTHIALIK
jgi:von Willebrand factor type A domain-containing protein/putative Flp pilus-assembly TadE/G-like protein